MEAEIYYLTTELKEALDNITRLETVNELLDIQLKELKKELVMALEKEFNIIGTEFVELMGFNMVNTIWEGIKAKVYEKEDQINIFRQKLVFYKSNQVMN